jgi:hypothetical protein
MDNSLKPYNVYFVYFQYFATCEGMTDSCAVVFEHTEKKAIEKFLRAGMMKHLTDESHIQDGINYFKHGVRIYNLEVKRNHKKVRDILKDYLAPIVVDSIMEASAEHALHEFNFHLYRNFS